MNTRSLEQFQRLLTQHTGSEEEPAEGSLLWAAEQLRRIARMLEDMQTGPRRSGAAVPPAPEAMTAPVPRTTGRPPDDTGRSPGMRAPLHPAHPPPLPGGRASAARPAARARPAPPAGCLWRHLSVHPPLRPSRPPGTPAGAARRLQPPYGRRDLQQCRGALPGPPLRHHGPARLAAAQAGGGTAGRSPRGTRRPPPELIPDLPFRPDGKGCGLSRFFVRGLPRAADSPPGRRDIPAIRHRIPSCASPPSASSAPQAAHRRPFLMLFLSGSLSPAC